MDVRTAAKPLIELVPTREFFVGIDSDGCVFDSMGIKHRECFCPWLIGFFGLQPVAEAVRQCKDFADLFSKTRGANRHITTVRILTELLPSHPMTKQRNFKVPQFKHYCDWVNNPDSLLSNEGLEKAVAEATGQAKEQLQLALKWSCRVNESVNDIVKGIPPFPYVIESLEKINKFADSIVCSSTPYEALRREWDNNDLTKYVSVIAGQEMGKKAEHLDFATNGKYDKDKVLMIGDAPGDYDAAKVNGVLFYPIVPGDEVNSWKRFYQEAFNLFISGEYAGPYQGQRIAEFQSVLPEKPYWLNEG